MALPVITIVGRLTADPVERTTQSGKTVVSFTVAASRSRFNKETNQYEDTGKIFVKVSAWDRMADYTDGLSKGSEVVVVGEIEQVEWADKDGVKHQSVEVKFPRTIARVAHTARQSTQGTVGQGSQKRWGARTAGGARQQPPQAEEQPYDPWNAPEDDEPGF